MLSEIVDRCRSARISRLICKWAKTTRHRRIAEKILETQFLPDEKIKRLHRSLYPTELHIYSRFDDEMTRRMIPLLVSFLNIKDITDQYSECAAKTVIAVHDIIIDLEHYGNYRNYTARQVFVSAGGLRVLVNLLSSTDPRLVMCVAKLLANISQFGREAFTERELCSIRCLLVDVLPALVKAVRSVERYERFDADGILFAKATLAAGMIRSIAGTTANKVACLKAGAVPALLRMLLLSRGEAAHMAALALEAIAWKNDTCKAACMEAGLIPVLVRRLSSSYAEHENTMAASFLENITEGDNDACKVACVEAGAIPALVKHLLPSNSYKSDRARNALYNISQGNSRCKAAVGVWLRMRLWLLYLR